ncbi:hypothetical protein BDV24DRAFT_166463 [Aspergillus arachidicola]|uniref:Uncharacterized protein n=1 Tax=Aspergillus arachidicola TaxID=656916 RepID=A0A5N6Y1D9_9EURO|nr:hypothetical protein BDV24DRAFT_166463 [Aspergillus arachidicola]
MAAPLNKRQDGGVVGLVNSVTADAVQGIVDEAGELSHGAVNGIFHGTGPNGEAPSRVKRQDGGVVGLINSVTADAVQGIVDEAGELSHGAVNGIFHGTGPNGEAPSRVKRQDGGVVGLINSVTADAVQGVVDEAGELSHGAVNGIFHGTGPDGESSSNFFMLFVNISHRSASMTGFLAILYLFGGFQFSGLNAGFPLNL